MNGLMEDLIKMCDVALLLGVPLSSGNPAPLSSGNVAPLSSGNVAPLSSGNPAIDSSDNIAADLATRLSMYLNETTEGSKVFSFVEKSIYCFILYFDFKFFVC